MSRSWILPLTAWLIFGCGSSEPTLFVDLRTDYLPVAEMAQVEVSFASNPTVIHEVVEDDYFRGVRVARFDQLPREPSILRVRVFGPTGALRADQRLEVTFAGSQTVTVVITRSCEGVVCPAGDPRATECLGGVCQPPECDPARPETCGEGVCRLDSDCLPEASECGRGVCREGVCFEVADASSCEADESCSLSEGCVPIDVRDAGPDAGPDDAGTDDAGTDAGPLDAGPMDPRCGMPCSSPDSCMTGVWECSGAPTCVLRDNAADGTMCAASEFGPFGACAFSTFCAEDGILTRTISEYTCQSGACRVSTRADTTGCTRDTERMSCGGTPTCEAFVCRTLTDFGTAYCRGDGQLERRCMGQYCRSGACTSGVATETGAACTVPYATEGDQCGFGDECCRSQVCVPGSCF